MTTAVANAAARTTIMIAKIPMSPQHYIADSSTAGFPEAFGISVI
jgi:hypothetical protein